MPTPTAVVDAMLKLANVTASDGEQEGPERRFDMGAWRPEQELIVRGAHVYLWTIPDKQTP